MPCPCSGTPCYKELKDVGRQKCTLARCMWLTSMNFSLSKLLSAICTLSRGTDRHHVKQWVRTVLVALQAKLSTPVVWDTQIKKNQTSIFFKKKLLSYCPRLRGLWVLASPYMLLLFPELLTSFSFLSLWEARHLFTLNWLPIIREQL